MSAVPQGTTAFNRLGDKIQNKYIAMNIFLRNNSATGAHQYRCAIVRFENPSHGATSDTAYIFPVAPIGHWNTAGSMASGRYTAPGDKANAVHVLWDSGPLTLHPAKTDGDNFYSPMNNYFLKPRKRINFNSAFEDTVTSNPDHNCIFFMSVSTNASIIESFNSQLCFTDS